MTICNGIRFIILFVFTTLSVVSPADAVSKQDITAVSCSLSVQSPFQHSGSDEKDLKPGRLAFKGISKANYLHALIGNALVGGSTVEYLIDRIIYQQSMIGSLFNIQLGNIIKDGESFLCTHRSAEGEIRLRYSIAGSDVSDAACRNVIPLSGGANLLVEIVDEKEQQSLDPAYSDEDDLLILARRAATVSGEAKRLLAARFAYRLRNAPAIEIEKFISSYPLDIHDSSNCLLEMLAAINILQNEKLRRVEAWPSIQKNMVDNIRMIASDGNIPLTLKTRLAGYGEMLQHLPSLLAVFFTYKSFFSKNPPYLCEAMEVATRYAMAHFASNPDILRAIDVLYKNPIDTIGLINNYRDEALSGKQQNWLEISAGLSDRVKEELSLPVTSR